MASIQLLNDNLDRRLAAHLLRRSTYCPTKENIDLFIGKSVDQAVDDLFAINNFVIEEAIDYQTGQPYVNTGIEPIGNSGILNEYTTGLWVNHSLTDLSIRPKLGFWLHTTFTATKEAGNFRMFYDYLKLLRHFSYGNLKALAVQVSFDNTMLYYLNGRENTKANPNENYAREFFELFTIGKGPQIGPGDYTNYTEDDIVTAARVLTGFKSTWRTLGGNPTYWNAIIGIQTGRAQYSHHDEEDKTFSAKFDNTTISAAIDDNDMFRELNDFVNMVFAKEETAKNYCRKLYRYFVNNKISAEVESDIIAPLAQTLIANNYEIVPCVKQLLKSEHFYDRDDAVATDNHIGSILKSPLENLTQTLSFFKIQLPDPIVDPENHYHRWYALTANRTISVLAGMDIYRPDSVAGYPAYFQEPLLSENWFSGSTLIARYKLAEILLTGRRVLNGGDNGGVEFDIVDFVANGNVISFPAEATSMVQEFTNYLFAEQPLPDRFNYLLNDVFLDNLSLLNWEFEWTNYMNTGNDESVRIPLERLFKALLSSQEFQMM